MPLPPGAFVVPLQWAGGHGELLRGMVGDRVLSEDLDGDRHPAAGVLGPVDQFKAGETDGVLKVADGRGEGFGRRLGDQFFQLGAGAPVLDDVIGEILVGFIGLVVEPDHFDRKHVACQDRRLEDRQHQFLDRLPARLVAVVEQTTWNPWKCLTQPGLETLGAVGAGDGQEAGFLLRQHGIKLALGEQDGDPRGGLGQAVQAPQPR